jgi:hypothetical protein
MARPRVLLAGTALLLGAACISSSFGQPTGYNGYFPGYYSPSTAGESLARGRADVVRSQGQFLLDSSQAASQFETARSQNIDNRYKATQAYFDLRRKNREGRAAEAGPRPTQEDLVRWAQAGKPKPLTASDLNPANGDLDWPKALTISAFDADRKAIQSAVTDSVHYGGLSMNKTAELKSRIASMQAGLKDRIKDYDPNTYLAGKNFLQSLAYQLEN